MKTKNRIVVIITVVVLLAGAGFGVHSFIRSQSDKASGKSTSTDVLRVPVVVTLAERMWFERRLTVSGNVQAKDFAMVSPRMKGPLDAVYVDEGEEIITVSPKKFLGDLWGPINDAIRSLGGGWIRDGRDSRWEIRKEDIE